MTELEHEPENMIDRISSKIRREEIGQTCPRTASTNCLSTKQFADDLEDAEGRFKISSQA